MMQNYIKYSMEIWGVVHATKKPEERNAKVGKLLHSEQNRNTNGNTNKKKWSLNHMSDYL